MAIHCVRHGTDANAHTNSYSDTNSDTYANSETNSDAYSNGDADAYTNTNSAADLSGRGCSLRGTSDDACRQLDHRL